MTTFLRFAIAVFSTVLATVFTSMAFAQSTFFDSKDALKRTPASADKPRPEGWVYEGVYGLNFSLTSSQDVVGQTDGASQTYGTNDKVGYSYFNELNEWRNDLTLREATTKTPSLPRFIKSDDELKFSTIYLYTLPNNPKIGPYARAEAAAPIFKGEDVRSDTKTYRVTHANGTVDAPIAGSSIRLTDGFKPLTTKEGVGFFYKPLTKPKIQIETRLGFGAQQIKADGQYALKGINDAGEVEVTELSDVSQAGLEAGFTLKGQIDEKSTYELGADAMTPFVNDKKSGDTRDAWRLTNVDGYAKLTSKITDWASFGYDYKLKIQPQLVDRAQQIHMLVVSITYPTTPGK